MTTPVVMSPAQAASLNQAAVDYSSAKRAFLNRHYRDDDLLGHKGLLSLERVTKEEPIDVGRIMSKAIDDVYCMTANTDSPIPHQPFEGTPEQASAIKTAWERFKSEITSPLVDLLKSMSNILKPNSAAVSPSGFTGVIS